jgi:hypothetical protein
MAIYQPCIDANGKRKWKSPDDAILRSRCVLSDGRIVVKTGTGYADPFVASDGSIKYKTPDKFCLLILDGALYDYNDFAIILTLDSLVDGTLNFHTIQNPLWGNGGFGFCRTMNIATSFCAVGTDNRKEVYSDSNYPFLSYNPSTGQLSFECFICSRLFGTGLDQQYKEHWQYSGTISYPTGISYQPCGALNPIVFTYKTSEIVTPYYHERCSDAARLTANPYTTIYFNFAP